MRQTVPGEQNHHTQQHNRDIRVGEQTDHTRAIISTAPSVTTILRETIRFTPTNAGTVVAGNHRGYNRGQQKHRHPGKHRDLFQVKAVNFKMNSGIHALKVPHAGSARKRGARYPRTDGYAGSDQRTFSSRVNLVLGFLTINNVVAFFIGRCFWSRGCL